MRDQPAACGTRRAPAAAVTYRMDSAFAAVLTRYRRMAGMEISRSPADATTNDVGVAGTYLFVFNEFTRGRNFLNENRSSSIFAVVFEVPRHHDFQWRDISAWAHGNCHSTANCRGSSDGRYDPFRMNAPAR